MSSGEEKAKRWNRDTAMTLSVLFPGAGQLYKGQPIRAAFWFVIVLYFWFWIVPGVVLQVLCAVEARMGDETKWSPW
jgi:hypothetical protein